MIIVYETHTHTNFFLATTLRFGLSLWKEEAWNLLLPLCLVYFSVPKESEETAIQKKTHFSSQNQSNEILKNIYFSQVYQDMETFIFNTRGNNSHVEVTHKTAFKHFGTVSVELLCARHINQAVFQAQFCTFRYLSAALM